MRLSLAKIANLSSSEGKLRELHHYPDFKAKYKAARVFSLQAAPVGPFLSLDRPRSPSGIIEEL
jgi:hypothetical protein